LKALLVILNDAALPKAEQGKLKAQLALN